MLMVIFGAGASFDSVPSKIYNLSIDEALRVGSYRPPLANQLFEERRLFAERLKRYPQCLALVPRLRYLRNRPLEQVLEEVQAEAEKYPRVHQELAAVRYYLHDMLWNCGANWLNEAYEVTNYRTLLREIDRFRHPNETVSLVTFNYDTLLESGLEGLDFNIKSISDYVNQRADYKVFKLHGSVNWGRIVSRAPELEAHRHDRDPKPTIKRMIDSIKSLQFTSSYTLVSEVPMAWHHDEPVFPAIAIPVVTKTTFECPTEHLTHLENELPKITKILIVGWRCTEKHFLDMLAQYLPKKLRVQIVSVSEQERKKPR
jgi:hypothetical protein